MPGGMRNSSSDSSSSSNNNNCRIPSNFNNSRHPHHLQLNLSINARAKNIEKKRQKQNAKILKGILLVVSGFVVIPVLYLQVWLSGTFIPYHHYYSRPTHHHRHNDGDKENSSPVHEILRDFRRQHRPNLPRPSFSSPARGQSNNGTTSTSTATGTKKYSNDDDKSNILDNDSSGPRLFLTAYLESPSTLYFSAVKTEASTEGTEKKSTILKRNTTSSRLIKREYPHVDGSVCRHRLNVEDDDDNDGTQVSSSPPLINLPIDDYPTDDPFLPWIHDYFVSEDLKDVRFIAQNRRRCDTGPDHIDTMKYWEPQIALFQPIPIIVEDVDDVDNDEETNNIDDVKNTDEKKKNNNGHSTTARYKIATSVENATYPATRFQCRFHNLSTQQSIVTMSEYKFDYEYVSWRKASSSSSSRNKNIMFERSGGKDNAKFWLSTLLFTCPIPEQWRRLLGIGEDRKSNGLTANPLLYLDLIPIRTPPRLSDEVLLTESHVGLDSYQTLHHFELEQQYGTNHILPPIDDSGRWANLPLCPRRPLQNLESSSSLSSPLSKLDRDDNSKDISENRSTKPYQFVACTWTSASYTRRGDAVRLSDSATRLREWILFHLMVGVDHIYVYDNTDPASNNTDVLQVVNEFRSLNQVTYLSWPCTVCNNNRPSHSNPGERSSQYGAEASCRERFGPLTEWMTFLDADEYLVPMEKKESDGGGDGSRSGAQFHDDFPYDWRPILDKMLAKNISVIQFRSSRAKPRRELMEELEDQSACVDPSNPKNDRFPNIDRCTRPMSNETFLHVYNCEYIRSPKPSRFDRARKQIYRPSYVWNHFVHYSTVTADNAETYKAFQERPIKDVNEVFNPTASRSSLKKNNPEVFADELKTGVLVHARSVLPHETRRIHAECFLNSKVGCMVGHLCEDTVEFIDSKHKDNVFHNSDGSFCNCWKNHVVEDVMVPRLERLLRHHQLDQYHFNSAPETESS